MDNALFQLRYLFDLPQPNDQGKFLLQWKSEKLAFIFNESCIYAQIWLRKTWHNLFSFARKVRFSALPPLIEFGHCRLAL